MNISKTLKPSNRNVISVYIRHFQKPTFQKLENLYGFLCDCNKVEIRKFY